MVGRNEPCPCGSGRKYKKCCAAGAGRAPAKGPFRFVEGNCRTPTGYAPSVGCYRLADSGEETIHFVLVIPAVRFATEDAATERAEGDLLEAGRSAGEARAGADWEFAAELKRRGYVRVENPMLRDATF